MFFPIPPHLLKSMRNTLYQHDIVYHECFTAQWIFIEKFYEEDSQRNCRLAPKLTQKHVSLPPFGKMKVKLAAQVFSNSVAAAIETYTGVGALPMEAMSTSIFCRHMNKLFDCFILVECQER